LEKNGGDFVKIQLNNRGEVIVEAALYFPFVIMIVFLILVLSIMQLNQYILNFQVSRVADVATMNVQYDAIESIQDSSKPSFSAGLSQMPNSTCVVNYYKAKQNSCLTIGSVTSVSNYSDLLESSIKKYSLVNGFLEMNPSVSVKNGFTDLVTVEVTYDLRMPGFIKYVTGESPKVVAKSCTTKVAIRPVETMRRYDAIDNQLNDYYGGNGWMDGTTRYSDVEFDRLAVSGCGY